MVSLSFVLYLMVVALPRVAEDQNVETKKSFLDRWAHSHIPEKVDVALNTFFLKLLRRVKVFLLKLDNNLGKHLKNMKLDDASKKPIDFSDITRQEDEEKIKS
jgi:hypothetical protein